MFINLSSKKLFNFLGVSIFLSLNVLNISTFNKEVNAEKNSLAATDKDLYLYGGMGASYLCIATKTGIAFPKAVTTATGTYVQVIQAKHGGLINKLGGKQIDREELWRRAEFHVVSTAVSACPDSVPKDVTKKIKDILKENKK